MMRMNLGPGRKFVRHRLHRRLTWLLSAFLCNLPSALLAMADHWPTVALPNNTQPFNVGAQIAANGLPMRLQGFLSPEKPEEVIQQFRQILGKPVVENWFGQQRVLGQLRGEYYVSVQVEPAGRGSRGIVALTNLKAAYDTQAQTQSDNERWTSRLPAGSRLISRTVSQDGRRSSTHLVYTNNHDDTLNRDRLRDLLQEDGLILQHEGTPVNATATQLSASFAKGKTLFFKGSAKDAMATIYRDHNGETTCVLNIVSQLERLK